MASDVRRLVSEPGGRLSDSPLVNRLEAPRARGLLAALLVDVLAWPRGGAGAGLTAPDGGRATCSADRWRSTATRWCSEHRARREQRLGVRVPARGRRLDSGGQADRVDAISSDSLGSSVAMDSDTIVAGTPLADIGTSVNHGAVYTVARTAHTRGGTAELTVGDGGAGDRLGFSVAIGAIDGRRRPARHDRQGRRPGHGLHVRADREVSANRAAKLIAQAVTSAAAQVLSRDRRRTMSPARSSPRSARTSDRVRPIRLIVSARPRGCARLTTSESGALDRLGSSVAVDGGTIVAVAPGHAFRVGRRAGLRLQVRAHRRSGPHRDRRLTASGGLHRPVRLLGRDDAGTMLAGAQGGAVGIDADQGSACTFARTGAFVRAETAKLTQQRDPRRRVGSSVAVEPSAVVSALRWTPSAPAPAKAPPRRSLRRQHSRRRLRRLRLASAASASPPPPPPPRSRPVRAQDQPEQISQRVLTARSGTGTHGAEITSHSR